MGRRCGWNTGQHNQATRLKRLSRSVWTHLVSRVLALEIFCGSGCYFALLSKACLADINEGRYKKRGDNERDLAFQASSCFFFPPRYALQYLQYLALFFIIF